MGVPCTLRNPDTTRAYAAWDGGEPYATYYATECETLWCVRTPTAVNYDAGPTQQLAGACTRPCLDDTPCASNNRGYRYACDRSVRVYVGPPQPAKGGFCNAVGAALDGGG